MEKHSGKSWKRRKSKQQNFLTFFFFHENNIEQALTEPTGGFNARILAEKCVWVMLLYTALLIREIAVGHCGSTPRLRRRLQALRSYPRPLERCTSRLRLLSPEPSRVRLMNREGGFPTEAAH